VNREASDDLTQMVRAAYAEELFLPDYGGKTLHLLRASRGRAWFVTRWMYEEGKHSLALGEWLIRSGKQDEDMVRDEADRLLARETRDLVVPEPVPAMVENLTREQDEVARYDALVALARAENDGALAALCAKIVSDERSHAAFFRDALRLIGEHEPARVAHAVRQVVGPAAVRALRARPANGVCHRVVNLRFRRRRFSASAPFAVV
jgi:acyl-[acyl-carrier-protein] desaturase